MHWIRIWPKLLINSTTLTRYYGFESFTTYLWLWIRVNPYESCIRTWRLKYSSPWWEYRNVKKVHMRMFDRNVTRVIFLSFDNFFQVTLIYACLLLRNTKANSQISIINFITYPKRSQILQECFCKSPTFIQNSFRLSQQCLDLKAFSENLNLTTSLCPFWQAINKTVLPYLSLIFCPFDNIFVSILTNF